MKGCGFDSGPYCQAGVTVPSAVCHWGIQANATNFTAMLDFVGVMVTASNYSLSGSVAAAAFSTSW
jgi:hypothetical protein